jgi:hypothetical protein
MHDFETEQYPWSDEAAFNAFVQGCAPGVKLCLLDKVNSDLTTEKGSNNQKCFSKL